MDYFNGLHLHCVFKDNRLSKLVIHPHTHIPTTILHFLHHILGLVSWIKDNSKLMGNLSLSTTSGIVWEHQMFCHINNYLI